MGTVHVGVYHVASQHGGPGLGFFLSKTAMRFSVQVLCRQTFCSWVNFSVWIAVPHEFHERLLVVFAHFLSGQHVGEWRGCSLFSPAFVTLNFSTSVGNMALWLSFVCRCLLVPSCASWDAYWHVSLCVLLKHLNKSFIHFYWIEERWAPCVIFNRQAICQITCFAGIYFQPFYPQPSLTSFVCCVLFGWFLRQDSAVCSGWSESLCRLGQLCSHMLRACGSHWSLSFLSEFRRHAPTRPTCLSFLCFFLKGRCFAFDKAQFAKFSFGSKKSLTAPPSPMR